MVSQGAQTNGMLVNGRKLMKSFSEGGRLIKIPPSTEPVVPVQTEITIHEPLHRTQSDEPPRSPFVLASQTEFILPETNSSSSPQSECDVEEPEIVLPKVPQEIIIDFEPQSPYSPTEITKKRLLKTVSDGEMLLDQRKTSSKDNTVFLEKKITSISHENIKVEYEPRSFTPYFQNSPIKNEGIFKHFNENAFSSVSGTFDNSGLRLQDSIDEEFHENLIYEGRYLRRSGSSTSDDLLDNEIRSRKANGTSPDNECIVPSLSLLPEGKYALFASNDSLANDVRYQIKFILVTKSNNLLFRDHSDGIWNESQATVLQVDSGTDNGTALSSSEMNSLTTPGGISASLLTPSSRRKHLLLLQHQQRSSIDTDMLDEELSDHMQVSILTC